MAKTKKVKNVGRIGIREVVSILGTCAVMKDSPIVLTVFVLAETTARS